MYEKILDAKRLELLRDLTLQDALESFYLAGGTALSLQLGLRVSVDFDFFTPRPFNADTLRAVLSRRFSNIRALVAERDTCDLLIEGVRVSFFGYPYPLVRALVPGGASLPRLRMADPVDIAVMKLSAIGGRGSRKDFYDLYQIYRSVPGFDGEQLLSATREKLGQDFDVTYMLMGLGYFDDAENEVLPKTFVPAEWTEIKRFFMAEQQSLFEHEEARERDAGQA